MMPPNNVQDIKADMTADFERDRRDAEAFRKIGQAGWVLLRRSELDELLSALADIIATTGRVMAQDTPETHP